MNQDKVTSIEDIPGMADEMAAEAGEPKRVFVQNQKNWTPAEHYAEAVVKAENAAIMSDSVDVLRRTNALLESVAHALLAAVRSELDYQEKREAESTKPRPPEYAPRIEEDDDRP